MDHPTVRYRSTKWPEYLELDLWDGTCRGVVFRDAADASEALAAGRAEFDASAIMKGFLPLGATLVSRAGVAPSLGGAAGEIAAAAKRHAAASDYITSEKDERARLRQPHEARIYDRLANTTAKVVRRTDGGTTLQ